MKFEIVSPAKSKKDFLLPAEKEFLKRIKPHARLDIREITPAKLANKSSEEVLAAEGKAILQHLPPRAYVFALSEDGKSCSSRDLAAQFEECFLTGWSHIAFVIGGPFGLSPEVKTTSQQCLSLSAFTFTSQLARVILLEQIYRAVSINKGLPYHKGSLA